MKYRFRSQYSSRLIRVVLFGIVVSVAISFITGGVGIVRAAPNQGPDPNFFNTGTGFGDSSVEMNYVVSRDNYTNITSSNFRIYTNNNYVTLRVYSPGICSDTTSISILTSPASGTWVTDEITDTPSGAGYGDSITQFTLSDPQTTAFDRQNGTFQSTTSCTNSLTLTVPAQPAKTKDMLIGANGMYVFNFSADMLGYGNLLNGFRIAVLSDSGAIISQVPGGAASAFGTQIAYPRTGSTYGSFTIPFGPDCSVNGPTNASVQLYDLDSGTSIQPEDMKVRILRKDRFAPDAPGNWAYVWGSISGSANSGQDAYAYFTPYAGDQETVTINFTVIPGSIYKLEFAHVYGENTLQLNIPFSSVWYYNMCSNQYTKATAKLDVTPASFAQVGQQYSAAFSVVTSGSLFGATMDTSRQVWWDNGDQTYGPGDVPLQNVSEANKGAPASGTTTLYNFSNYSITNITRPKICAQWTISPPSRQPDPTIIGSPSSIKKCIDIGKAPLAQVTGGDVIAGRSGASGTVSTLSTSLGADNSIYGSWSEYAIMSSGTINSPSAGVLGRADGRLATAQQWRDNLTFANDAVVKGNFGTIPPAADLVSQLASYQGWQSQALAPSTTTVNVATLPNKRLNTTTTDLSVHGTVQSSSVISTSGTVTIDGDITTTPGPYTTIGQIPQLVIRAKNIIIASGVKHVDAWLIASDTLSTCDTIPAPSQPYYNGLTTGTCTNQLEINGLIQVNHLLLRRTAGGDTLTPQSLSTPAEAINLRADSYLWLQEQASASTTATPVVRTQYVEEVASPRL